MSEFISNADASRMGKAVEHLVAASCIIQSRARLNVSTSLVDDEGVDLVFHRRDRSSTLAVQVKARMSDSRQLAKGTFIAQVRGETLKPRPDLCVLFVAVDVVAGGFDLCWLVPSEELVSRSHRDRLGRYRFVASAKPGTNDQWRRFRLTRPELPNRILELLDQDSSV